MFPVQFGFQGLHGSGEYAGEYSSSQTGFCKAASITAGNSLIVHHFKADAFKKSPVMTRSCLMLLKVIHFRKFLVSTSL